MATTQVIVGGGKGIVAAGGPYYYMPFGDFSGMAAVNERAVTCVASPPGTCRNYRLQLSVAPGVGNSYTFTFRKNGVNQSLSVTISGSATTGSDLANSFVVAPGDRLTLQASSTGSPPNAVPSFAWEFIPDTDNNFWLAGNLACSGAKNMFSSLYGGVQADDTEANVQAPMPVAGTFSKLYVDLSTDPGTAPDAYTFRLRIDGANGNLVVTIVADNTTGSDLVNTDVVAVNQDVNLIGIPVSTPSASPRASFGLTFVPSVARRAPVLTGSGGLTMPPGNSYNTVANRLYVVWGAEAGKAVLTSACRMRSWYCKLDGAPGSGKSYVLGLHRNGGDTPLTVTIADPNTQGSDTVNYQDMGAGDGVTVHKLGSEEIIQRALRHGFTLEVVSGPAGIAAVNEVAAASIGEVHKVGWASIAKVDEVA